MSIKSLPYRIAKKCEQPGDSRFWGCMNFFFCQVMIVIGLQVYRKVRSRYIDKQLMVFPSNSVGDVAFYGRFKYHLLKYMEKSERETILLCSGNVSRALEAIGVKEFYVLGAGKLAALSMACHYYGRDKLDVVNVFEFVLFDYGNIHDKRFSPHSLSFTFEVDKIVSSLERIGCNVGNTVVLSPYENSMQQHSERIPTKAFWVELADELTKNGLNVCTNCAGGEKEPPIKGTKQVFPRFNECEELVSQAGAAVVLRSGFADFVEMTRGTLVTLYPSEAFWNIFRLWSSRDHKNHYELIYEGAVEDETYRKKLINEIVGMIKDAAIG